jgi:hypothetical protein
MEIKIGSRIVGRSGKTLVVDRIEDSVIVCGELRVMPCAVVEVLPPRLPIGTRVKLSVALDKDKRIDGQVGKIVAIIGPTIRRVRWQPWEGAIERNFQLSYLREVAA